MVLSKMLADVAVRVDRHLVARVLERVFVTESSSVRLRLGFFERLGEESPACASAGCTSNTA